MSAGDMSDQVSVEELVMITFHQRPSTGAFSIIQAVTDKNAES